MPDDMLDDTSYYGPIIDEMGLIDDALFGSIYPPEGPHDYWHEEWDEDDDLPEESSISDEEWELMANAQMEEERLEAERLDHLYEIQDKLSR